MVFIHGFCENKEIWRAFEEKLSAGYRPISVDLPGFGESTTNSNFRSVEAMANEVKKVLDAEAITSCVVVAHSLGGYVALALAEQHPWLLKGFCLFHSTAYADSEEKKHTRNKTADFLEKKGLDPFLDTFVPALFFAGRREQLGDTLATYRALTRQTPLATAVAVTQAMRDRPDRTNVLQEAAYPVMFIAGREDTAVPLEASREQFFLPKESTVHILAETGHMGMYEQPAKTLEMVESFVRQATAS